MDSDFEDEKSGSQAESEDEGSELLDDREEEGNAETDAVKLELETEEKVESKWKSCETGSETLKGLHKRYSGLFEDVVKLRYQDITNLFVEGNMFLVCGDSLLCRAMKNDYHSSNGGQTLHLIYLCERLLQLFQRKGATLEIVFFDVWKDVLVDESFSLARALFFSHLTNNTTIKVHQFSAVWDPKFSQFIDLYKPGFLLFDFSLPLLNINSNISLVELVLFSQVLFTLSLDLPCVSCEKVELGISTFHAYAAQEQPFLKNIMSRQLKHLKRFLTNNNARPEQCVTALNLMDYDEGVDVRHIAVVMAASCYLIEETDSLSRDWVRAFLIYSAVMEILPLENRGCPGPKETPSIHLETFIKRIQYYMEYSLACLSDTAYSYNKIADLWHGNLFISVLRHISAQSVDMGSQTVEHYLKFVEEVQLISGQNLEAFPVTENSTIWNDIGDLSENAVQTQLPSLGIDLERLIPISCHLSREFCGDLLGEVQQQALTYDDRINIFIAREASFSEIRHWHSKEPLSEEQDRIRLSSTRPTDSRGKWFYDKMRNKMAKFMDIYGASIEGRKNVSKPIVVKSQNVSKKDLKTKKSSKKALKIVEANLLKTQEDTKSKEEVFLQDFRENFKKLKSSGKYKEALEAAKLLKDRLTLESSIQVVLLYIARLYYLLWCEECRAATTRDLAYAKELFLTCRQLLKGLSVPLLDADKKELGKWLWHLGFDQLALLHKLPAPKNIPETFKVDLSAVRFQLMHLGADLQRVSEGSIDSRVDFIPDPWQRKLFDIIDQRESAVIVAPTSSGKTYASYYCMETIIREDNEGVVVYISPTKALVNQVAATVYSRFKGKNMPEGKSVYGVFTRDYRTNDMNCQILVTVPECLEMLLLSPRRQAWVRRLRYIIFDEIHCLAGQAGGLSWESGLLLMRCPFLALSATIGNPYVLHKWLQEAENFKRVRDKSDGCLRQSYRVHLVEHTERHSDLKKYLFSPSGDLLHIHPYAYIDETVIKEHEGIPRHISLSSDETLQLYCAMEEAWRENADIISLTPETYFVKDGFLTRSQVRCYENELKDVMQKWAFENKTMYEMVINLLKSPLGKVKNESGFRFVVRNFFTLLDGLKSSQMFPCILFRYDKSILDFLFEKFVKHCESLEVESYKTGSSRRKESNQEKEKKSKVMSLSTGKAKDAIQNTEQSNDFSLRRRHQTDVGSLGLLESSSEGSIRNVGFVDRDDVKFIEHRLLVSGCKRNHLFPRGLRVGMGKHHAGMTAKERSAVEMLFRMRVLNAVLATGTLALGIHMPCKTVVIGGDSSFINSLSYHQMAGRSGRRGFDTEGNVIFFGMGQRKIKTVLTGKLPSMIGNFPLTVSLVLRLLLLVSDVTELGISDAEAKKEALSRALTFLNCNLVYQHIPELKDQMRHFFAFSTQLLMLQCLLDDDGNPQNLCGLITHLHYHEPGNLVFAYLLRCGALRGLCEKGNSKDTEKELVLVLSHLFARMPLHPSCLDLEYKNSKVILPPLPEAVADDVRKYNEEVEYIYGHYFRCVATHIARKFGADNTLPLSKVSFGTATPFQESGKLESSLVAENVPRTICSRFAALSGHGDWNLYSSTNIISNIRHDVFTDVKVVPLLDCSLQLNGYAWDFYNHGILSAIIKDNYIKAGEAFGVLKDFMLMLKTVHLSLEELSNGREDDALLNTLGRVTNKFVRQFNTVFNIIESYM